MRRLIGLIVVLVAVLASPAGAKVPRFQYAMPSIVPGNAIGGIEVGDTRGKAKATWGTPDDCFAYKGTTTCSFSHPGPIGDVWIASYYLKQNRVVAITVETSEQRVANDKVKKLKTAKGIGVGSLISKARQKYGIPIEGGGEAGLSKAKIKRKGRCTLFYAPDKPYTVIDSVTVGKCGSVSLLL